MPVSQVRGRDDFCEMTGVASVAPSTCATRRGRSFSKRARKGRAIVPMTAEAREAPLQAKDEALSDHVIEWDRHRLLSRPDKG